MEPRSSSPQARLDTIEKLASAGIKVNVLVAPIIPGLTDEEIPAILEAVSQAGACWAGYVVLRLPLSVEPVFLEWLRHHFPDRESKIVGRIKSLRGGKMYRSDFGSRMSGEGIWAEQIGCLFEACRKRFGLLEKTQRPDSSQFRVPNQGPQQLDLF